MRYRWLLLTLLFPASLAAQKVGGSANVQALGHLPIGTILSVGDIEIEQELSRPYAYISRINYNGFKGFGFHIISITNPARPKLLYTWNIERPELHEGLGGADGQYFKLKGRYYYIAAIQFGQNGPDHDIAAVIVDVTSLPDTTGIKEVARIHTTASTNGFHNVYPYKHSDGRTLLFTADITGHSSIYDLEKLLAGDPNQGRIGAVPGGAGTPDVGVFGRVYHDFYVAYDPATRQDKFYGAAVRNYFIYDVTRPETPQPLATITGVPGLFLGHTIQATPDGRYVFTYPEEEFYFESGRRSPARIFDLKPALEGQNKVISRSIGAYTADWQNFLHNMELRWPYIFISGYEDGLQIVNMMDPTNPYTTGHYYTCQCPHEQGYGTSAADGRRTVLNGAWGVDVRNADGLIVISDLTTGFWTFRMDGFDGWNGHNWGMPNVSSAQDWDNGPDGAPKPSRVS